MNSAFIYSPKLAQFDFGYDHPFKPERATKTYDLCMRYGVLGRPWMQILEPLPLDRAALTRFHDPHYLELLREASAGRVTVEMLAHGLGTHDNPVLPGIYEWAITSAGGTSMAADRIVGGGLEVAFNPLGGFHHAGRDHAGGFCYINDVVITALDLLDRGLRVAFVDIDAHHCNGVQDAFYDEDRILVISLHESGDTLYPGTGKETEIGVGRGLGFTVNVPLGQGTDDEIYADVFNEIVPPLISAYQPDILVAEIGADTQISDPLTHLRLTNNGYREVVQRMKELCPRILALGGGGYDVYRTARCWTLAWSILNEVEPEDEFAGLVGGMMFGPEHEVGSLRDYPHVATGPFKDQARVQAQRVVSAIKQTVFPIHGIPF